MTFTLVFQFTYSSWLDYLTDTVYQTVTSLYTYITFALPSEFKYLNG